MMWWMGFLAGVGTGVVLAISLMEYLKRDARAFFAKMREDYWAWHDVQIIAHRTRLDFEMGVFKQRVRMEQSRFRDQPTWISEN